VASTFQERLVLTLFAPLSVIALFSALNLTFKDYKFKPLVIIPAASLHPGDAVPAFTTQTTEGHPLANTDAAQSSGIVINFVSPDCPFCEEQLPILNAVAAQLPRGSYRFVNVSARVPSELRQRSPSMGVGRGQKRQTARAFPTWPATPR